MRILLVTHGFPRHADDSAGGFLLALARGQMSLGHEVLVVAPHSPGVPERDTVSGVPVRRYRYGPDEAETLAYIGTMHEQVLHSWAARWRLLRLLAAQRLAVHRAAADFRPAVVSVHWWFPGGFAVWPGGARAAPYVLTSHGTDLFLLDRFRAASRLAGPVFRGAGEVTVISSPLVDRVRALGVAADRITVVPMPLSAEVFSPTPEDRGTPREAGRLLYVGRLVERKGVEFAVRALALLRAEQRPVTLTVVGEGPEREALGALARSLGVDGAVAFTGGLAPRAVADEYRRATALLLPAVTDWKGEQEGFGMVLVEAMLNALPVVATRSGGIPDVITHEETGLLVPERDPGALARSVGRVLDDPVLAERLGRRGTEEVRRRFAPDAIARRFEPVYLRAAGRAS